MKKFKRSINPGIVVGIWLIFSLLLRGQKPELRQSLNSIGYLLILLVFLYDVFFCEKYEGYFRKHKGSCIAALVVFFLALVLSFGG